MFEVITAVRLYALLVSYAGVLGQNTDCSGPKQYQRARVDAIASESAIATHKTRFHGECLFYCYQTPGCLSYNYQYSGNGEHLCELNNITLEACPAKLRPKEGYAYYVEMNDTALQPYGSKGNLAKSCLDIKQCRFEDGEYWMFHEGKPELVYCFVNSNDGTQINLALNKPTNQSSTTDYGNSSRAVDGRKGSDYIRDETCTHTSYSHSPWWRVDLQKVYMIRQVDITNRGDCCSERLAHFQIRIGTSLIDNGNSNPNCRAKYDKIGAGETKSIVCDTPLIGRYVNIIIPNQHGTLTLCEVEVYP